MRVSSVAEDGEGRILPRGERGEIVLRGGLVMKGYYKNPQATEEASAFGWHHTGDIGVIDEDGFVYIVDRKKDMIITGGFNVFPSEIEQVLWSHPAVQDCAVIGVPDPRLIEVPAAYVILRENEQATPDEIMAWAKERLANFRVPRYVKVIDSFEHYGMTGSSKVQKNKLRAKALVELGLDNKKS